jgi:hypothetical protein
MSDSSGLQPITVGPEHGRDDGDPLPRFSEREQCVRRAALEQNIRLDVCNTAGRIEQPANRVAGVRQQQGMG